MRKDIIKSPSLIVGEGEKKSKVYIFLGGPIQGAPSWRDSVPMIDGITWISPERENFESSNFLQSEWEKQVDWETFGLAVSDIILFWIPSPIENIEGRDYAQTTRMELLECLSKKKNIVVGIEKGVHARRYMEKKCNDYGVKVYETFNDLMDRLKEVIISRVNKVFFTSDTHFSSDRALLLSKRPFDNTREMDLEIIRRWNKEVTPDSIVYHLGDFGNYDILKFLNGNIHLILGNYEYKEMENLGITKHDYKNWLLDKGFSGVYDNLLYEPLKVYMAHEPIKSRNLGSRYCLFGHIHGRQKIKTFGIDVGIDSNNYFPMSEDDVKFYLGAIENGYYDEEVFS